MTQYRTFEEDWNHKEDISDICIICGNNIDKEKLRESLRRMHAKTENVWLPFTIFLRSILDNER
jgi:hypothetical protein